MDEVGALTNSYATGAVTGSGENIGGLVGGDPGVITNAYYNSQTGGPDNGIGAPLTSAEMVQTASFGDWDFEPSGNGRGRILSHSAVAALDA